MRHILSLPTWIMWLQLRYPFWFPGGDLRLRFDPDFDTGVWPGPWAARGAVVGEAWVGPRGCLDILETALGLSGVYASELERAAMLVPALRATPGFWERSASADPLGAAQRLLNWRDHLVAHGWRGKATGGRLGPLWAVTESLPAGFVDRVAAVATAARQRASGLEQVELLVPRSELDAGWQSVIAALEERGTNVEEVSPDRATPAGNLAAVQEPGGSLQAGDPSLQLIRPHGPMDAADAVAAWLAAQQAEHRKVVITPDPTLDAALHRHGAPTSGSAGRGNQSALLQVLSLALELLWRPVDPRRAAELLTLPDSPVPSALRWRLARSLHDWPAVGSDAWESALNNGLELITSEERRERVRARVNALFTGLVDHGQPVPVAAVADRVKIVSDWAAGHLGDSDAHEHLWNSVVAQCSTTVRVLDLLGAHDVPRPQLRQVLDLVTARGHADAPFESQAGLTSLARPGGIAGPADIIVWWNFTRDARPSPQQVPLTRQEREALKQVGVTVPDAGELAERLARRERRPLAFASQHLLLVSPTHGTDGEDAHPHPLWDEITASLKTADDRNHITHRSPIAKTQLSRSQRARAYLPEPTRTFTVPPELITARDQESPSSLGMLVGCSLRHGLNYQARVRPGLAGRIELDSRGFGNMAHELLARVAAAGQLDDEADDNAAELFDELAQRMSALLFLPGLHNERAELRDTVSQAAAQLARLLYEGELKVHAVEEAIAGEVDGIAVGGRPDLVLRNKDSRLAVIDLKWGGEKYRRDELEGGTAYQLAVYAKLLAQNAASSTQAPALAFYILRSQRLMTNEHGALPNAEPAVGASGDETWLALHAAVRGRQSQLKAGVLEASAVSGPDGEEPPKRDELVDGRLVLRPPCGFCDYAWLCGRALEGGA